jgi:polyphenol oxidase
MFFSKKLNEFKNLKHCFFSRKNGVSEGTYKSLNCGKGSNDKEENVLKNLNIVSNIMGCKKDELITLNQRHTSNAIYLEDRNLLNSKLEADGIICKTKNIGISVLTADCVPILFYDPKKKIIGCAHAGWKGALNGIIDNVIKKFNDLNSDNNDLIAVIGPCIDKNNYEVKADFFEKFIKEDKKNKIFFKNNNNNNYNFDLRGFVNNKLFNLNIKKIENIQMDTFSQKEFFYSYRRSCKKKEQDYGRCISVILMT